MNLWETNFSTLMGLPSLPRLLIVASEQQYDTSYCFEGRHRTNQMHCIFKYSLEGEGVFRNADGEHRVPAEHGFLCEIRDPDTAYYYPSDARGPWTFVFIAFVGESATQTVRDLTRRYGPVYAVPKTSGTIKRLMRYQGYDGTHQQVTASEGAHVVQELLLDLAACREGALQNDPGNILVRSALETIRSRIDENLNVSEVARILRVSREHLTRVFSEQTGQTPHEYIVREKTMLACRLLKETTLTAKEITARIGFSTPAHFTRTFRRMLRMTPTEFRDIGAMPAILP